MDCVIWDGPKWSNGRYGMDKIDGISMGAHRAAWVRKYGKIPFGMVVCHKCDNGLCVNTEHLFIATQSRNMIDCRDKGRLNLKCQKGENNNNSKFKETDYRKIALDKKNGMSYSQICNKYGIKSNGHLRNILRKYE